MENLTDFFQNKSKVVDGGEVQAFLDAALSGVVYIRIGTRLALDIQQEIVSTFYEMKQYFIWEHEQVEFCLPSNVIIGKYLPHKLILAHKNTITFVTMNDISAIKQGLHSGLPMLILTYLDNELCKIRGTTVQNIVTMRIDERRLSEKLNCMLNNKNLKSHAKEIASLLHHNSADFSSQLVSPRERNWEQKSSQISTSHHLQLDGLGALFIVIFLIVKVSLKFCQFYNSWEWKVSSASKKTK